ncbi:uncharacterized protein LOC130687416 isoform X2 [Daphnia carinata]|uniref:uncharacterized protein LOC130687416 isoform X2 n=1 Tax=Daphnia carinata TaxID=120202 RepID=UPI00257EA673|nr:uncharacterized protein LOC130687416 isoform X2 [Daphnia carinata]
MGEEFYKGALSVPIRSLDELKSWKPLIDRSRSQFGQQCFTATEPGGSFREQSTNNVPKTIICHDMKGGYLEDSFIEGCSNAEAYSFIQWGIVDIFVYFSHHFITVPPPCWIHAAHLHGVPILGTIITEWDEGTTICKEVFSSKDAVNEFVSSITDLTLYHNCDGWLINIENSLEKMVVDNILYFLRRLKQELVFAGNCGKIIWYDSVTKDGKLDWQNELNAKNKDFFDSCDGIFLNYVWEPANLTKSAIVAGERIFDVYVGIDVFGRNCFGGGGFNTDAAFSVVRQHNLSAAVFAPGWIYECHPIEQFKELSFKFWSLLFPYMNLHGTNSLPIRTSFCPGYGQGKYDGGQLVDSKPWHNMSRQQLQPCLAAVRGLFEIKGDIFDVFRCGSKSTFGKQEVCNADAFNGGGCLNIQSPTDAVFPLFFCEIPVIRPMTLAIVLKTSNKQPLLLKLCFMLPNTFQKTISCPLVPCMDQFRSAADNECRTTPIVSSIAIDSQCDYIDGSLFRSKANSSGWDIRLFQITLAEQVVNGVQLNSISLESKGETDCKIGYLSCF